MKSGRSGACLKDKRNKAYKILSDLNSSYGKTSCCSDHHIHADVFHLFGSFIYVPTDDLNGKYFLMPYNLKKQYIKKKN